LSIIIRIVSYSEPVQGYCLGGRENLVYSSFYAKHYFIIFIHLLYSICIAASGPRVANFVICLATGTVHGICHSTFYREGDLVFRLSRSSILSFFLSSCNSCFSLLPCVPVTSILPSIFPSKTCFRKQFLRNMWPIKIAFFHFILCSMFLSPLNLCNTSSFFTRSIQMIFSGPLQHHI